MSKKVLAHVVNYTEYERGWGCRHDGSEYYATKEAAMNKVSSYNNKYNNEKVVPDWYIVASYGGTEIVKQNFVKEI